MIPNSSSTHQRGNLLHTEVAGLAGNPVSKSSMEAILCRSIIAAHLLIGDISGAEKVVMKAIDIWKPEEDDGEQLFQTTLRAAVRTPRALFSAGPTEDGVADCKLPIELRRVLELPHDLRQSFVLRVLIGLPLQACAHILEVGVHEISEYCRAALKSLSALDS